MVGTPLWWYVQFAINFLSFISVYVFSYKIVRSKIKVTVTHVLFCIIYTLALAPVFYFLGGYIFNIVNYIFIILNIKLVTKRSSLGDLTVIFAIYYISFNTITHVCTYVVV